MKIRILHLLEGAKQATGVAVIIDVFRAFSVESYLFGGGVKKVIPVADIQLAYDYQKNMPDALLAGERGGKICPGFDFGNSPAQIVGADLTGRTVIHTTSAGTQGLFGAEKAQMVLGASLTNAAATAEYIRRSGCDEVSLVCMGLAGKEPTEEDTLCAEYIKSLLEGTRIPLREGIENLKYTSGAKFFDPAQNDVFPREDFDLCTRPDIFPFALRLREDEKGIRFMNREDIWENGTGV